MEAGWPLFCATLAARGCSPVVPMGIRPDSAVAAWSQRVIPCPKETHLVPRGHTRAQRVTKEQRQRCEPERQGST